LAVFANPFSLSQPHEKPILWAQILQSYENNRLWFIVGGQSSRYLFPSCAFRLFELEQTPRPKQIVSVGQSIASSAHCLLNLMDVYIMLESGPRKSATFKIQDIPD
jgi:hypothetical protein